MNGDTMVALFYLALFGLPVLVGYIAHHNGRRWWAWGIVAVFFPSPIILVLVIVMGKPLALTPAAPIHYVDAYETEEQTRARMARQ